MKHCKKHDPNYGINALLYKCKGSELYSYKAGLSILLGVHLKF